MSAQTIETTPQSTPVQLTDVKLFLSGVISRKSEPEILAAPDEVLSMLSEISKDMHPIKRMAFSASPFHAKMREARDSVRELCRAGHPSTRTQDVIVADQEKLEKLRKTLHDFDVTMIRGRLFEALGLVDNLKF